MAKTKDQNLTKREQQVMDIIYKLGHATATELQEALPDPPTNSAVRSMIRGLINKNVLSKKQDGFKYIYYPTVEASEAKKTALSDVLKTFFNGSAKSAFVELLDLSKSEMDKMEESNPIFGGAVKAAKWLRGVKSTYRVELKAEVVGTMLNPFVKKNILMV